MKDPMYKKILSCLADPFRPFIPGGQTIGEICAQAAGIREAFAPLDGSADEPVCLCVEDRSVLLAALLASIGGGPRFILPHASNRQVLEEIRDVIPFKRILTDAELSLPESIQAIQAETCLASHGDFHPVRSPDDIFLTLFTGGSTGTPRSWSKTPRNLFGEAFFLAKTMGIRESDLLLSTVPQQHIYGLLCSVLLPFVASAQILPGTCLFPQEILAALASTRVTVLVSVPIHYRSLKTDDLQPFSLRLALSSAGAVDATDAAFFREKTGLPVTEIFGSTETGGIALRTDQSAEGICLPFNNVAWKTVSGRLGVRSDFISPDLPRDADGFFMTSDRVAPAGNGFRLLGRVDGIVKVAGKRVDLEEVRNRLKQIPGVKDAHVLAMPLKRARHVELAALVVTDLNMVELKAAILSMGEPYARPRRIRVAAEIPMLPNGKIDRVQIEQLLSAAAPLTPAAAS